VIAGFVLAHFIGQGARHHRDVRRRPAAVAAGVDQPAEDQSHVIHRTFGEVEWITLFFFIGLFVVVAGIEKAGALEWLAHEIVDLTGGDFTVTAYAILWVSALLSSVVDNIPFVATMIPVIQSMGSAFTPSRSTPCGGRCRWAPASAATAPWWRLGQPGGRRPRRARRPTDPFFCPSC